MAQINSTDVSNVVNAIGSLGSAIGSKKELKNSKNYANWYYENLYKKSNEWQLENITKPYYAWQQSKELEMIPKSLKANIDAMRDVGINPLMINGGLGNLPSVPSGEDSLYTPSPMPDLGSIMSGSAATTQSSVSAGLMMSEVAKNMASTDKVRAETEAQHSFNDFARELYEGQAKTAQNNAILLDRQASWTYEDIGRIHAATANLDAQTQVFETQLAEIAEHISLMRSQGRVNDAQLDLFDSQVTKNIAEALLARHSIKLQESQIQELGARVTLMNRQGSTYAVAEYIQSLLASGDKTIQDGIKGDFVTSYYKGEDGKWHYAVQSGNLDILGDTTEKQSTELGKNIQRVKFGLDLIGTSAYGAYSDFMQGFYKYGKDMRGSLDRGVDRITEQSDKYRDILKLMK